MKNIYIILSFIAIVLCSSIATVQAEEVSVRYTKFDENGQQLPSDAEKWAIVLDNLSGLYWEVKTVGEGVHGNAELYKFSKAKKLLARELNKMNFGGFSDWRLPSTAELTKLRSEGEEPFIDMDFFPNTQPAAYHSWNICGSGEFVTEKVSFGSQKVKGKSLYARAVRGEGE